MNCKDFLLKGYNKSYDILQYVYDYVTSRMVEMSIGDVIFGMGDDSKIQNLTISRLLDIENYYQESNDSFYYLNAFSSINPNFDRQLANRNFIKLLKSVEKKGYNQKYAPIADSSGRLWNGTHRVAVCLYRKIESVTIKILKRESTMNNAFKLENTSLESSDYERIRCRYKLVLAELMLNGITYCCIGDSCDNIKQILKDCFGNSCIVLKSYVLKGKDNNSQKQYRALIQFYLKNPTYCFMNHEMIVKELYDFKQNNNDVICSLNCKEGQVLYHQTKKIIV